MRWKVCRLPVLMHQAVQSITTLHQNFYIYEIMSRKYKFKDNQTLAVCSTVKRNQRSFSHTQFLRQVPD